MRWFLILWTSFVCVFSGASEQISSRNITYLWIYDTYTIARLSQPATNADGCSNASAGTYVKISHPEGNVGREQYAAVLSARAANKSVGFGVSGCGHWGSSTVPLVYRVDM